MATPTFAPAQNPSFPHTEGYEWRHDVARSTKGYDLVSRIGVVPDRPVTLTWARTTEAVIEYIVDFFHQLGGTAGKFFWQTLQKMPAPVSAGPELHSKTVGSLPIRTYFVRFSWYDSARSLETKASPETSLALLANEVVQAKAPIRMRGADSFRIYASETSGATTLQGAETSQAWTEPVTGLISGAAPITATTLFPLLLWRLVGAVRPEKLSAHSYRIQLQLREQLF